MSAPGDILLTFPSKCPLRVLEPLGHSLYLVSTQGSIRAAGPLQLVHESGVLVAASAREALLRELAQALQAHPGICAAFALEGPREAAEAFRVAIGALPEQQHQALTRLRSLASDSAVQLEAVCTLAEMDGGTGE